MRSVLKKLGGVKGLQMLNSDEDRVPLIIQQRLKVFFSIIGFFFVLGVVYVVIDVFLVQRSSLPTAHSDYVYVDEKVRSFLVFFLSSLTSLGAALLGFGFGYMVFLSEVKEISFIERLRRKLHVVEIDKKVTDILRIVSDGKEIRGVEPKISLSVEPDGVGSLKERRLVEVLNLLVDTAVKVMGEKEKTDLQERLKRVMDADGLKPDVYMSLRRKLTSSRTFTK